MMSVEKVMQKVWDDMYLVVRYMHCKYKRRIVCLNGNIQRRIQ